MKLQEICNNLHFNNLKEPWTVIKCIKNLGQFVKAGDAYTVLGIYQDFIQTDKFYFEKEEAKFFKRREA